MIEFNDLKKNARLVPPTWWYLKTQEPCHCASQRHRCGRRLKKEGYSKTRPVHLGRGKGVIRGLWLFIFFLISFPYHSDISQETQRASIMLGYGSLTEWGLELNNDPTRIVQQIDWIYMILFWGNKKYYYLYIWSFTVKTSYLSTDWFNYPLLWLSYFSP